MKSLVGKFIIKISLFIVICSISCSNLFAGKWTGDVDSDWSNSANWFQNDVHVNGEDLTFGSNPANYPVITTGNIEINSFSLGSNTITQNGGTIIVANLNISGAQGGGKYYQNGGLLIINHNYDNDGGLFSSVGGSIQFSGTGGATQNFDGTNQFNNVIIDSGADPKFDEGASNIIYISGDFSNYNTDLDNSQGTVVFNGSGTQTIYSESTNNTFYDLEADQTGGDISFNSDVTIANNFNNSSGSTVNDNGNNVSASGGDPLPVELTSFVVLMLEGDVELVWETATEVNNYGFEVHRTDEQFDWEKVGFVEGYGNSNSPKSYSFKDATVSVSGLYFYRLKQIDIDGRFEYSDIAEIDYVSPNEYTLNQNYPNPFNPTTTISYSIPEQSHIQLTVFNIFGEEIIKLVNDVKEAGYYTIPFSGENLASGTYFYTLETDHFIGTKKFLLLK